MITYNDKVQVSVNPLDPEEQFRAVDANEIKTQVNNIYGVSSGALGSPYELTFDIYQRYRTLNVTLDLELSLAAAGKVDNGFETLTVTGDGVHLLTFPATWVMLGDSFNFNKVQEIAFRWTGTYVIGVITTLDDVDFPPELLTATIETLTDDTLDLVFDIAVNITTSGWTVTASGGAVTVSAVASGSGTTTPKFTLSRAIAEGETVTVSYDTGTGSTESIDNIELETITNQSVTNNVNDNILLHIPFTGTTIDTAAGTVTNPDVTNLTISQNNKLIFTRTTDVAVASTLTNFWRTVDTFTRGVFAALLNRDSGFNLGSVALMMVRFDNSNYLAIIQTAGTATVTTRYAIAGVNNDSVTAINVSNRFRIRYNVSNQINFEYWNGSAWTSFGHAANTVANIGANVTLQLSTSSSASDAPANAFSFDEVYITAATYSTVTP